MWVDAFIYSVTACRQYKWICKIDLHIFMYRFSINNVIWIPFLQKSRDSLDYVYMTCNMWNEFIIFMDFPSVWLTIVPHRWFFEYQEKCCFFSPTKWLWLWWFFAFGSLTTWCMTKRVYPISSQIIYVNEGNRVCRHHIFDVVYKWLDAIRFSGSSNK